MAERSRFLIKSSCSMRSLSKFCWVSVSCFDGLLNTKCLCLRSSAPKERFGRARKQKTIKGFQLWVYLLLIGSPRKFPFELHYSNSNLRSVAYDVSNFWPISLPQRINKGWYLHTQVSGLRIVYIRCYF